MLAGSSASRCTTSRSSPGSWRKNSALRMAMSLLVFGVLLVFLPLLGSGVKSQLAVLKGKAEPPAREYDAHAVVQLGVAVATVAVVTVVTGIPTIAF